MDFHEAANIFPLDEEHLHDLADDIRDHGQQVPIEVCDDKIIDGRRRWKACKMANVVPTTTDVSPDDPVAYVLSLNLHRRNLTVSQAAMCAQRTRAMYDDAAKKRQVQGGKDGRARQLGVVEESSQPQKGKSRDEAGAPFGVSGFSVDAARDVIACDSIPELAEAVDAGKVTVNKAKQIARAPEAMRPRLLEDALSGRRASPATQTEPEPQPNGKVRGVGIQRAHEAIACLKQIPKNDALRKRGFQVVTDWIKHNT